MKCHNALFAGWLVGALLLTSCTETLEPLLDGQKVSLFAPSNRVVSSDTVQTFSWTPVNSAVQYELQVVSPTFDSIVSVAMDTLIASTQFNMSLGQGIYQWRVRAMNTSTTSQYSDPWNLTVQ